MNAGINLKNGNHNRFSIYGTGLATLVLVMALSVLIGGWTFSLPSFRRILGGYAAMVPSTAISFVATSLAVILAYRAQPGNRALLYVRILAGLVALVAIVDLAVIAFTPANGIDQFLRPAFTAFPRDSMAIATATSFLLSSVCLLRFSLTPRKPDIIFTVSATAGLGLSAVALTGYAFDTNALYEVSLFTAMALHTAASFLVLFASLLLLRPDSGWMAILTGSGGGSQSARRLVPVVIAAPFTLCLVALWATRSGLVDFNFRLSVLAIAMVALLSASAFRHAAVQNRIETQLKSTIADRELLLREVYHRVKNNLQMTTSLLRMGERYTRDPAALDTLSTTIKRVEAIGAVHRILISARVPSNVRASEFIEELAANIVSVQDRGPKLEHIDIETDVDDFNIHIDRAVTIGLLVNELLTNALKHAFIGRDSGRIDIGFHRADDGVATLTVADNGIGRGYDSVSGTGTRIIRGLISQLGANWSTTGSAGTIHTIELPTSALDGERHD